MPGCCYSEADRTVRVIARNRPYGESRATSPTTVQHPVNVRLSLQATALEDQRMSGQHHLPDSFADMKRIDIIETSHEFALRCLQETADLTLQYEAGQSVRKIGPCIDPDAVCPDIGFRGDEMTMNDDLLVRFFRPQEGIGTPK